MNVRRRWIAAAAASLAGLATVPSAFAQTAFPSKPMRLIVPYPAGGGADLLGRIVAQHLGAALNQTVNVENKPGANGSLGAREAAQSAPDGHTLVLVTDGLYSIFPFFVPEGATNPMKDLVPVVHLVDAPLVIAARPGLGVDNLAQLIALAKKEPGKLTYGANNTTSTHYLATAVLQKMAGIEMRHIPFAGTSAALPQLAGGQIDLLIGQNTSIDAVLPRGVKYLAVTSGQRFSVLPDVSAVSETLPGYDEPVAMGLMTPAGTPPNLVDTVNRHVNAILKDKDVRAALLRQSGATPTGGSAAAFQQLIERQLAARATLIKELNLQQRK